MRHFLGGWAAGTILVSVTLVYLARKSKSTPLFDYILWSMFPGILFGLATWGLWP